MRTMYKATGYGGVASGERAVTPKANLCTPNQQPVIDRSSITGFRIGSTAADVAIGQLSASDPVRRRHHLPVDGLQGRQFRRFTIDNRSTVKTAAASERFLDGPGNRSPTSSSQMY